METLPEESDRAVAQTREFLVRLAWPYGERAIKEIGREVRAEALALLRHYPFAWNGDFPAPDNLAKRDNTPAANATPSQGSVRNGCTLTDAERAAVSRAEFVCAGAGLEKSAIVLRGLLERTA